MAGTRKGDVLSCQVCGLILAVEEPCGCAACDVICCGQAMAKGKLAARKARKVADQPPAKTAAVKTVKEKPAKAAAKGTKATTTPKPAATKPTGKKPAAKKAKR